MKRLTTTAKLTILTILLACTVLVQLAAPTPRTHWLFDGRIPFLTPTTLSAQGYSTGQYLVPPGACGGVASGNATGTNGLTTAGTSATPVFQIQTSVTGTNTHTYVCDITPPSRVTGGTTGAVITGADFLYGVQTTNLGTQAVVLASGTMNSVIVFGQIALPAAAATETPSTVAPTRADSGSLVLTPAAASFNVAQTTAGAFFRQTFTPGAVITTAPGTKYLLTVPLLNTATSATVTQTAGAIVYTR